MDPCIQYIICIMSLHAYSQDCLKVSGLLLLISVLPPAVPAVPAKQQQWEAELEAELSSQRRQSRNQGSGSRRSSTGKVH